jgi:hypothetical protein
MKIKNKIYEFAYGLALVVVVYMFYTTFAPVEVVVMNEPIKLLTPEVEQGQYVEYTINICKKLDIVGEVYTSLISDNSHNVQVSPVTTSNLPKGCGVYTFQNPLVSESTPNGKYKVLLTINYKVNPFKTVTQAFTTDSFVVK